MPAMKTRQRRRPAGPFARWIAPAVIVAGTVLAFLPSLQGEFLRWDDDVNFLDNPGYRGLGPARLRWMFTTFHMGLYIPATWMTLGLDYALWGMNAAGYRLTSLVLHAANGLLLYALARRLLRTGMPGPAAGTEVATRAGAAVAALVFALHPLRVESVAWVTERRDVLSGLFCLLAILGYLRARDPGDARRRAWYGLSVAAFALALLSKPMAVSLPVILVVLDIYPLGRLPARPRRWLDRDLRPLWLEKIPFVLLSVAAGVVAVLAMRHVGNLKPIADIGIAGRIAVTLYAPAFYLWKTLLPAGLSPLYELPARVDPLAWPFLLSAGVVVGLTALAIAARRRWPALAATWAVYVVTLLPVSGLVQNGPQIAADRYTYLPAMAWALLAGAGAASGWAAWRSGGLPKGAAGAIAGAVVAALVVLGGLTARQVGVWRDTETLWRHALATSPSSIAHSNLADTLFAREQTDEAIRHAREALRIRPNYVDARNVLGLALAQQGRLGEARAEFVRALEIDPTSHVAHNNLGVVFALEGRPAEAITHFQAVLRLKPDHPDARRNLREVLMGEGRYVEANEHARRLDMRRR